MAPKSETRVHWNDQEWFDVLTEAKINLADTRAESGRRMFNAQKRTLTQKRRRSLASLTSAGSTLMVRYLEQMAAGWTPTGTPPPSLPPMRRADADAALEAQFTSPARVIWTSTEKSMLAVAVKHRIDTGAKGPLTRLYFDTQLFALGPARCRPRKSLKDKAEFETIYREGLAQAWTLPPDTVARLTGKAAEYEAQRARSLNGAAYLASAAPAASETPSQAIPAQAAPAAAPAPILTTDPAHAPDPLAAQLLVILGDAASRIAAATREHIMRELDLRMGKIAAEFASSMRANVHTILAAELGPLAPLGSDKPAEPPSPPPSAAPDASPAPPAEPLLPAPVRVDFVGLIGPMLGTVRDEAARCGVNANFVDVSKINRWSPAATVIAPRKFISHKLDDMVRKAGSRLIFAEGGTGSIVSAMHALINEQHAHAGAMQ